MIIPGLCSVTFRTMNIDQIASLARDNELGAIEWGADVHVPPGDTDAATRARAVSEGLVVTYGSYLFAAGEGASDDEIGAVLDTAVALGARTVRVWAPFGVTGEDSRRAEVVAALRRAAAFGADLDLALALEFHGGTLTETVDSALALLGDVDAPNLLTYWQPPYWIPARSIDDDLADLRALARVLANLHVYEWTPTPNVTRRALVDGSDRWRAVVAAVQAIPLPKAFAGPRVAVLEFVADDDPLNLPADALTLRTMVRR